jgi:hypothetical protein
VAKSPLSPSPRMPLAGAVRRRPHGCTLVTHPRRAGRLALLTVVATVGAAVVAPIPGASAAPAARTLVTPHAWGVDAFSAPSQTITKLQNKMNRSFSSFAVYSQIDEGSTYPLADARQAMAAGGLIYLNINAASGPTNNRTPNCYVDIVAGHLDADIDAWSQAILATHYTNMVIGFQHEAQVTSRMQPKCHSDTPSGYAAAYDHIYHRMRDAGVTAPFAWVPTAAAFQKDQASQYEPPVDDFSIIGADAYSKTGSSWRDASLVLSPFFSWAATHAPDKALMIGEIGADQSDSRAPQWYRDAIAIMQQHNNLMMVNWNASTGGTPYSPLVNAQSLQVWVAAAQNGFFG